MKKLLSVLLTLAMMLGCALAEGPFEYAGWWTLTGVTAMGVTVDPAEMGMEAEMALYEDGTCHLYAPDEWESGVWVVIEGGIAVTDEDNVTMNMMLTEEGALAVEQNGITLIFTPSVYAEPLCNLTMAEFAGDWDFSYLEYMGEYVDAETMGLQINLHLAEEGGRAAITIDGEPETYDMICEIEEAEGYATMLYCRFQNGRLDGGGMLLMMFSNGELVWYAEDEAGNPLYYCFLPAEE